ncbi:ATP-dependent RNA helicase HrpA [Marinicella sp. W31]|uniref:ATP-dependent RNA helicase HrpA n=1 Tax=Marinicella sp. W31 TaxID=3023713 RepID=UPI003757598D
MENKISDSKAALHRLRENLHEHLLRTDRIRIERALDRSHKQPKKMGRILKEIEQLQQKFQLRLQHPPQVTLPPELPISQAADQICESIKKHQVTVIAGETGSGKTTQIPKICLQAGLGQFGLIGCTQPRRIAAKSVAARVAEELQSPLGESVGYQVRFDERFDNNGWIKFMTDGILLQQTLNDGWLNEYDAIIIDEAHERSLNIDFLLGFLKQLCAKRADLKLIITSATIDTEKFSKHFNDAPIIEVSGRSYPVDIAYRPLEEKNLELNQGIIRALDEIYALPEKGDVLVFLPGEREIKSARDQLKKKNFPNTEILPLYARLTSEQQMQIFNPGSQRRIVLSTNVAETSLTVPGIRYVIDSGVARISRYSARSKIQGLQIESIAQDSANQRAGRCGRLAAGICYRLYSEMDFDARPEHTDPEILRTSLASVILQTMALSLGQFDAFPFIDRPEQKMISDGYQLLLEIQAIDQQHKLTQLGRKIARLPIDVQLARILLQAEQFGCLEEILIIVSGLSIQDVRERPLEWAQAADKAHEKFADEYSDFMSYLHLWQGLAAERKERGNSGFKKWCRDHFISIKRYMEWKDIHRQLTVLAKQQKLQKNNEDGSYQAIHKSLLSGFISHVGQLVSKFEYEGARNRRFQIFPGSGLFNTQPSWIMAAAIVHTSQVFARTVGSVRPEWIYDMAEHLIQTYYYGPYWSKKQGSVMGYQRSKLLGLTVQEKQRIHYGPKDPTLSREIFIEEALVKRQLHTRMNFYHHNCRLIATVMSEEDRQRKKDLLVEDQRLKRMYEAVIPHGIYSEKQLREWVQKHGDARLKFELNDLYQSVMDVPIEHRYPETLQVRQLELPLAYQFLPGAEDDGVTVSLDVAWLNALNLNDFEFLVPGLIQEKIETLIKSLPKSMRRILIPSAEYAAFVAQNLDHEKPFYAQVSQLLYNKSDLQIDAAELEAIELPQHLKMRFRLLDAHGKVIRQSRDFPAILDEFTDVANRTFQHSASEQQQVNGAKDWVFGQLQPVVHLHNGLPAYPGLLDQGDAVGLRLFETSEQAQTEHIAGLKRLIQVKYPKILKQATRQEMSLRSGFIWEQTGADASLSMTVALSLMQKTIQQQLPITDVESFDRCCDALRQCLYKDTYDWLQKLEPILEEWYQQWQRVEDLSDSLTPASYTDMIKQLDDLIYPDFVDYLDFETLSNYQRYLKGLGMRLDSALHAPQKEAEKLAELKQVSQPFYQLCEHADFSAKLQDYLMLLEEYRVSLFAQQLGTKQKVSLKRLKNAYQELIRV